MLNVRLLTEADVKRSMAMPEAVALAEKGVRADGEHRVFGDKFYMPLGEHGFVKPFSGFLEGEELAFVKSFTLVEGNRAMGLPTTSSIVLLLSAKTGMPACIMEADWITAVRTGASTAVTARYLARTDSRVATVFGAGSLGRRHCEALDHVFDFEEIRVVDVVPEASQRLCADLEDRTRGDLRIFESAEEAVRGADIIVTVTTGSAVNVESHWVKPGAFIARLGSHQEVALDLFEHVDKFVVDRWDYTSRRVPEMIDLIDQGRLNRHDAHGDWPDIAAGRVVGRESEEESILYAALGIWGEYAAILPQVYRNALELGLGKPILTS